MIQQEVVPLKFELPELQSKTHIGSPPFRYVCRSMDKYNNIIMALSLTFMYMNMHSYPKHSGLHGEFQMGGNVWH